jgi:hypothetical protein
MKVIKGLLTLTLIACVSLATKAQDMKVGLLVSPTVSWMSINDASIRSDGALFGIRMGVKLDYGFSSKWYFTLGTALGLNEGGKLTYRDGGSYLPLSELKLPQYNNGAKPISDQSTIEYHGQFWSTSLGLKRILLENADSKIYLEFPTIGIHRLIKARGSIVYDQKVLTAQEDILNDLRQWNLSISGGVGIESRVSRNAMFYTSLQYNHFLSDLTLNNGYKAILIEKGTNPGTTNIYANRPDKSKALINGLALTIGLYF